MTGRFISRVRLLLAFALTAVSLSLSADTWLWKNNGKSNWAVAGNWLKNGQETSEYPNGPDADVYFPDLGVNKTYTVNLWDSANYGVDITVHSLTFTNYMAAVTNEHNNVRSAPTFGGSNRGSLSIGAGGVCGVGDTAAKPYPSFNCDVVLTASQTWTFAVCTNYYLFNDTRKALSFNARISCAADVEWVVTNCPGSIEFGSSCDASEFRGTLKTNSEIHFFRSSTPAKAFGNAKLIYQTNDADWGPGSGYGGTMTSSRVGLVADCADGPSGEAEAIPFNYQFDFSSTTAAQHWSASRPWLVFGRRQNSDAADYHTISHTTTVSRALHGSFVGEMIIAGASNNHSHQSGIENLGLVFFPDRQHAVISGDNSGLTTDANGYITLNSILAVAGHENALGSGNAIPLRTSGLSTYASFVGLLAKNGITIASPISRGSINDYYMIFGASDPDSTCIFNGTIVGSNNNPMRLTAPRGAKATFNGVISGIGNSIEKCLEIFGHGDVELAAANTFNATPYVRAGRLLVANAQATNGKKILLGGMFCGTNIHVKVWNKSRSFEGMTDSGKISGDITYASKGMQWYTANTTGPFSIQGVEIKEGDYVLQNGTPEFGENEGVYLAKYIDNRLMLTNQVELTWRYGRRVAVDDGTWKGEHLYFCREKNINRQHILEDIPDADVAVMISQSGLAFPAPIDVVDNYSEGKSTIGMTCAGECEYSGDIALYRGVIFEAAEANSTLRVTGNVADANGKANAIGIAGAGLVVLPDDIDWTSRALDLRQVDHELLDEVAGGVYERRTLLRAKGVGKAASVLNRNYCGRWNYVVNDDEVVAVPSRDTSVAVNVLGMLPVTNAAHRTLIAVPWCAMGDEGDAAIQISNIVKTANLTVGDTLHCVVSNGTYDTWQLASNATTHVLYWDRVQQVSDSDNQVYQSGDPSVSTASRGGSLILFRHSPTNSDGTAKAFYLFGQSATSASATVTVEKGASVSAPAYTLIASPKPGEWSLNDDAAWTNVGSDDYISIYKNNGLRTTLYWDSELGDGGKWYTPSNLYKTVKHPVFGDLKMQTGTVHAVYRDLIPAGQGVWYVSRGGAGTPTVSWIVEEGQSE